MSQGKLVPPPLENSCFALPAGVSWMPVPTALEHLRAALHPITSEEDCSLQAAQGRILAQDLHANVAHPPYANSAVDGYVMRHQDIVSGANELILATGRAAAGTPYEGAVPQGQAVRILTGAVIPEGGDTVILQEDVATDGHAIAFHGPLKRGANTRSAGEDVVQGAMLFEAGHCLRAQDLALLAATGHGAVRVRTRLRVGILSTGDELCPAGETVHKGGISDANGPMLTAQLRTWGYDVTFYGIIRDDPDAITAAYNRAAQEVDVLITTGGASAGDEDHTSAVLRDAGHVTAWRIAVKPGRPLMMGQWGHMPVLGLPGNPVAAFVCALIFVRPALRYLAGGMFDAPRGVMVPAAFAKAKKHGRHEYLRARLRDGQVEVYGSEGSGRIHGLTWAEGLVELGFEAQEITHGTLVRYIPFTAFD